MLSRPSSCVLRQQRGQIVATYRALGSKGRVSYTSATGSQRDQAIDIRSASHSSFDRRQALLSFGTVAGWMTFMESSAQAEDPEFKVFYGMASPPTSYGGYGGNANEKPKYTFEYPKSWKSEQPSKSEKGTKGIDGRVVSPKSKDLCAFVITLGRAGEDGKTFILRDTESTFAGFAGADYNLQDALSSATNIDKTKRTVDGVDFFDYDIDSPDYRYLASIAVKDGKVFALFVRSPARAFKSNEAGLRHMQETLRLL